MYGLFTSRVRVVYTGVSGLFTWLSRVWSSGAEWVSGRMRVTLGIKLGKVVSIALFFLSESVLD